jgi:hypothetical protein
MAWASAASVFVRLHEWANKLRRDQPHFVAQFPDFPRPMLRAAASFHHDERRMHLREVPQHFAAL